jgi:AhpD family alkylhydroperoxidase
LPRRYLEIVLVVVSTLNKCTYCVAHHAPRLSKQGLSPEMVSRILDENSPGLDEVDRLVRDYAVQATEKPQYLGDAMFESLKAHFTEEEIVEFTLRIALYGFFTPFNDALQIRNGRRNHRGYALGRRAGRRHSPGKPSRGLRRLRCTDDQVVSTWSIPTPSRS